MDELFEVLFDEGSNLNVGVIDNVQIVAPVNHNELKSRDANDAHPISSITGLAEELEQLKEHVNNVDIHVTEQEKETWNNKSRVYRNASGALVISL